MRQLAEEQTEDTIPRLMAILSDEDVVYRCAAVQVLGVIGVMFSPVKSKIMTGASPPHG